MTEHRDYVFREWCVLPFEDKRDLWNHYWNPYEQQRGEKTRRAIKNAFVRANPELVLRARKITIGYADKWGWCIFVVVGQVNISVPQKFADIRVVKGVQRIQTSEIKWVRT